MPRIVDPGERREAIADAVVHLLRHGGLAAVTVRAVAAELGTSTSAVTHFVPSRDLLLQFAVEREADRWRAMIAHHAGDRRGADRIRAMVEAAALHGSERDRRGWIAIVQAAAHDASVARPLRVFDAWWDEELERAIAELRPPADDADAVRARLEIVATGLIVTRLEGPWPWRGSGETAEVGRLVAAALQPG